MVTKYYAMIDGEQKGPFLLEELPGAGVRPSTYIWCKGMSDWEKAEDNAEVCRLFRNHLYDLMHPSLAENDKGKINAVEDDRWKIKPDAPRGPYPTRFDGFLQKEGEEPLPTLDEIDNRQDKTLPPVSMIGFAWLATLFCCLPLGIIALVYAYKSKKTWKNGDANRAYEFNRKAKMWTGVSFFFGLISYGALLALSM